MFHSLCCFMLYYFPCCILHHTKRRSMPYVSPRFLLLNALCWSMTYVAPLARFAGHTSLLQISLFHASLAHTILFHVSLLHALCCPMLCCPMLNWPIVHGCMLCCFVLHALCYHMHYCFYALLVNTLLLHFRRPMWHWSIFQCTTLHWPTLHLSVLGCFMLHCFSFTTPFFIGPVFDASFRCSKLHWPILCCSMLGSFMLRCSMLRC